MTPVVPRAATLVAWLLVVLALGLGSGCDELNGSADARAKAQREAEAYAGPCHDVSSLLATTAGSPDALTCPNRLHRIEVQPATLAGEEIGALVTCRCAAPDAAPSHPVDSDCTRGGGR